MNGTIKETSAELARRAEEQRKAEHRQALKDIPLARQRQKLDARTPQHPALDRPLRWLKRTKPREIEGVNLDASRLTREEGEELSEICKRLWDLPEDGEPDARDVSRYELLVGRWAGDDHLFRNRRRKWEAQKKIKAIREEKRVSSLPKRPRWEEQGSVTLARFAVHDWLLADSNRNGEAWTASDLGVLVVILSCFENRDASLVANARLEQEGDDVMLVISGGIGAELRFSGGIGGSSLGDPGNSGFVRLQPALVRLAANKWITVERTVAETRIKLGDRARKVREGREAPSTA